MAKPNRPSLSKRTRFEVFKRDSFKCQYCGQSAPDVLLHVDHIKPVVDGGLSEITNLVTACVACNLGKSKIPLSDHSAVAKAKRQLDELQERREQIEMVMEWQQGLLDLESLAVEQAANYWKECCPGFYLNQKGLGNLRKRIAKFGLKEVLSAMREASTSYCRSGPDGLDPASVEIAIDKVGAICQVRQSSGGDEEEIQLYRIRGLVRWKFGGERKYKHRETLLWLQDAMEKGAVLDSLWGIANAAQDWYSFADGMEYLIKELRKHAS